MSKMKNLGEALINATLLGIAFEEMGSYHIAKSWGYGDVRKFASQMGGGIYDSAEYQAFSDPDSICRWVIADGKCAVSQHGKIEDLFQISDPEFLDKFRECVRKSVKTVRRKNETI